jgi:uncharacterized protein
MLLWLSKKMRFLMKTKEKRAGKKCLLTIACKLVITFCYVLPSSALSESKENKLGQIALKNQKNDKFRKLIKILSIDGGGIRGIIPALVLQNIEGRLKNKRHLTECFDVMAGTSTGGIIILLLNTPDEKGAPRYNTNTIVNLYRNFGKKVFYKPNWQTILSVNGWIDEKYSTKNLEKYMAEYFGKTRLSEALTEILIPTYDLGKEITYFFKRAKARESPDRDFYFTDIARATSAAPTYFKPAIIKNLGNGQPSILVDGGVVTNNPALAALVHAFKIFGKDNDFLVVSLGTGTIYITEGDKEKNLGILKNFGGKLEWITEIVPTMLDAASDLVDGELRAYFQDEDNRDNYIRFEIAINPAHDALDNTSPKNIEALERYAQQLIQKNEKNLERIVRIIDN